MVGERNARAQARIEAAMRRIELAAQRPAPTSNSEIEQRYRELWNHTSAALAELDAVIGSIEE